MSVNPREDYERWPEVRLRRDMRLHREVVLSRQIDLMPQALAGDVGAQKELADLSELARSFTAMVRGVFSHAVDQEMANRRRRAAGHSGRLPAALPAAGVWMLDSNHVLRPMTSTT